MKGMAAKGLGQLCRTKGWSPAACRAAANVFYTPKRGFAEDNMPAPFDKYKRPAAAKYWLSKYPKTTAEQDEYPEEFVYLDELEQRIESFHDKFQESDRFKQLYNEFGWEDHEPVTSAYPSLQGGQKGEVRTHGRGKKINPAWYIPAEFERVSRVTTPALEHMPVHLARNNGVLQAHLELPPEEPSVFKFWNAYQMFGMTSMVLLSKEIFMVGHDFFHACFLWFGIAMITSVGVDWWAWWYALRGQEFYDLKFFPLNEKVEELYKTLEEIEQKPSEKATVLASIKYGRDLAERLRAKKFLALKVNLAHDIQDKLAQKAKLEKRELEAAAAEWSSGAQQATDAYFADEKVRKNFMKTALASFKKGENAVLRAATEQVDTGSSIVSDKYTSSYTEIKDAWLKTKRDAGNLPWGLATDAEKKKQSISKAQKDKRLADELAQLRKTYHNFA